MFNAVDATKTLKNMKKMV